MTSYEWPENVPGYRAINHAWHTRFTELKDFISKTGAAPRQYSKDETEQMLGRWLYRQRLKSLHGKLLPGHRKSLESYNPALLELQGRAPRPTKIKVKTPPRKRSTQRVRRPSEKEETVWANNAAKVDEFIQENGKLPGRRSKDVDAVVLGTWISGQRRDHNSGFLISVRVDELNRIDARILASKAVRSPSFNDRLVELDRFLAQHGRIPRRAANGEAKLAVWMDYNQRESSEQRKKLIAGVREKNGLPRRRA